MFWKILAAFSLHVFTTLENGVLSYKVGNAFSSIDIFQIRIEGKGGHGSALEYTVDPIKAAMLIYQGIEGVVARETSMFHSATCSIGHFEAGTMYNVIPESALLEGTLRCLMTMTDKEFWSGYSIFWMVFPRRLGRLAH